jgi:hypothetical protein
MTTLYDALHHPEPSALIEIERVGAIIKKLRLARESRLQKDLTCLADILINDPQFVDFVELLLYSGFDCKKAMVTQALRDLCYQVGDSELLFDECYDVDSIINFIIDCVEFEKSIHFEDVNGVFYPTTKDVQNPEFMASLIEAAYVNGTRKYNKVYGEKT